MSIYFKLYLQAMVYSCVMRLSMLRPTPPVGDRGGAW